MPTDKKTPAWFDRRSCGHLGTEVKLLGPAGEHVLRIDLHTGDAWLQAHETGPDGTTKRVGEPALVKGCFTLEEIGDALRLACAERVLRDATGLRG